VNIDISLLETTTAII